MPESSPIPVYADPIPQTAPNIPAISPRPTGGPIVPYTPGGPIVPYAEPINPRPIGQVPTQPPPSSPPIPPPTNPPTSTTPPAGNTPTNSNPVNAPNPSPGGVSIPNIAGGALTGLLQGQNPAAAVAGAAGAQYGGLFGGAAATLLFGPEAAPFGAAIGGGIGYNLGVGAGNGFWNMLFPPHTGGHDQPSPNPWKRYKPFTFGEPGKYYDLHNFARQEDFYKPNNGSPGFDITRQTETRLNPALAPFNVFAINSGNSTTIYLFDATNKSIELGGYWDANDPTAISYLKTTPGLQATPLWQDSPPIPIDITPPPQPVPVCFVLPENPDGSPQPFKPTPTPQPKPKPAPAPYKEPDPVPIPLPFDPTAPGPLAPPAPVPYPDPSPIPAPSPSPGGSPGSSAGGGSSSSSGTSSKPVDSTGHASPDPKTEPKIPPPTNQTKPPVDTCNPCPDPCPKPEFEDVTVKVFDSCQTQSDGTIKPTFTDKSLSVPKGTADEVKTLFERIANLEALQCVTKDDCVTIPDWWQVRLGADRPQLSIQYYDVADSKKIPCFCVNLPHPDPALDISKLRISDYQKGDYMGVLTLSDNSKLIINAVSIDEAERVINELSSYIDASYLTGNDPKIGPRGGQKLKQFTARAKIVKLFSSGQKNLAPDKVAYIDEST